jgi:NAD(P)-dependent dehydrogenase (short-subunit alcohol dehydrogenase family)
MNVSLHDRTALVTGASRGIGAACARALGHAGARLLLTSRREYSAQDLADEFPGSAEYLPADLTEEDAPERVADWALQTSGYALDVLVNCAGAPLSRRARNLTTAQVDRALALNLRAPLILSVRIGREMARCGRGSIINISSVAATRGMPFQAGYSATKGGLEAMSRSLAAEWGPSGVRVNCVAPGPIDTELWREELPEDARKAVEGLVALRRSGLPEEIASAVVFLAGDASSFITAQVITVDGGLMHTTELNPKADRCSGRPLAPT